jgi:hypothetical protein
MLFFQRRIKCKYVGEKKFAPESITPNVWMPVIGFYGKLKKIKNDHASGSIENEKMYIYYYVIGNDGKLLSVASWNCNTMLDEVKK